MSNYKLIKHNKDSKHYSKRNAERLSANPNIKDPHAYDDKSTYRMAERVHSVDRMLEDAKTIIGKQIERFKVASSQGYGMSAEETKQLEQFVNMVVKIKKDERDDSQNSELVEQLKRMSTEELLEYYKQNVPGDGK